MDANLLHELVAVAPCPIVQLARRAQNDCAPERAHHNSYYVFELWLRMAAAVAAGRHARSNVECEELETSLKRSAPSVGHFVAVLRSFASTYPDEESARFWRSRLGDQCAPGFRWACEHGGYQRVSRPTVGHLIEALTAYRNRQVGHGAVRDRAFYQSGSSALFDAACVLARDGSGAFAGRFVAVEEVIDDARGERQAVLLDLTGSITTRLQSPVAAAALGTAAIRHAVLLQEDEGFVELSPSLRWQNDFMLTLSSRSRSKVEYLSYFTGESFPIAVSDLPEAWRAGPGDAGHPDAVKHSDWFPGYEKMRELGRGAMGVVYLARQLSLDMPVALKILPFAAVLDQIRHGVDFGPDEVFFEIGVNHRGRLRCFAPDRDRPRADLFFTRREETL